ncbi:MAG: hypothetical protein ACJ72Z_04370 [Pyrinomonadaceae bacterium]
MRNEPLKYFAVLSILFGCIQNAEAQKIKAVRDGESAGILSIKKARDLPDGDLAEKIEKDGRGKPMLAESPDKIRQAFVFCVPSGSKEVSSCVQRVFVTDLGTDETYEITGEELFIEANRLINGLKWINNSTLSYERWANPHFGHRYILDIKQLKQTEAFILSDQ